MERLVQDFVGGERSDPQSVPKRRRRREHLLPARSVHCRRPSRSVVGASTPTSSVFLIAMAAATAPTWDSAAGVWVGERAAGNVEVPDPLWIFGYGSLCWRPDFKHEETMIGRVHGWGRYFAQSSCDHRGTPAAPGLVATLLSDAALEALGLRDADAAPSSTCGLCYRVGAADAQEVLDNLDFREKGGYTREIIEVTPSSGGAVVKALLYSATPENPNFSAAALKDLPAAAKTIATAVGPSGPNIDYLKNLAAWLEKVEEDDAHVKALMALLPASGE